MIDAEYGYVFVEAGSAVCLLRSGPAIRTELDLEHWSRETSRTTGHPACSAAGTDPDGVLDEPLLVRGAEQLRVADAFAFPVNPSATTAPGTLTGERGADSGKEDANATR